MADVLSVLPTDCTFDQEGGLSSFLDELKGLEKADTWSVDLKSATDLIPATLYQKVFEPILGEETTKRWLRLLRERDFHVLGNQEAMLDHTEVSSTRVRYGRGQPMGALTSWPSMAIVHHALCLFAAQAAGKDPRIFTLYRVLGDDLVHGDKSTADAYLGNADALQVPISLSKTLSGKLTMFASQALYMGENVSHLSLSEELGVGSYTQRLELALRASRRGWIDWSGKSLAGFLRHLLSRKDYKSSVKWFQKGKLGTVAQAALVQTITVAGKALAKLNLSSLGSGPFLLAFANKVAALSPDSEARARKRWPQLDELELTLALRALLRMKKDLDVSMKGYFEHWLALRTLFINLQVRPAETICKWFGGPPRFHRLPWTWDPDIMLSMIGEHYVHDFDVQIRVPMEKMVQFKEAGGRRGRRAPSLRPLPGSKLKVRIPLDDSSTLNRIQDLLDEAIGLLTAVSPEATALVLARGGAWALVDEVARELTKLPRLPDFKELTGYKGTVEVTPQTIRMRREWVRSTSSYAELMKYCNLQTNFMISFADMTEQDGLMALSAQAVAALPQWTVSDIMSQNQSTG
jgi:hypothetical protein